VITVVARNLNEAMEGCTLSSGEVCFWRESGVRRTVLVGAFGRNVAPVAVKMFSHLIYITKRKFWTCNGICEDNAAVNCMLV
jgi:hypothetical protein